MRCLCCQRALTSREAKFWDKKILVCVSCFAAAEKVEITTKQAMRRAEEKARADLEQLILTGRLLDSPGLTLPGFGLRDAG